METSVDPVARVGRANSPCALSSPLITIAIPTFNRASLLKNCIRSALSQTYRRFEILVSDNASTDDTAEVLRQFCDQRLRVIRQKTNMGLLPNWNACLAEARGEYIVFVSDDDRIAPWMLQHCVALIEQGSQVPVILTLTDIQISGSERLTSAIPSRKFDTGVWRGTDLLVECLKENIVAVMCSIMIRTDALRAVGGFPANLPNFGADMAAWASLMMNGKAGFINKACSIYSVHEASETSKLALVERLNNEWKLSEFIAKTAACKIQDAKNRHQVWLESKRCFARRLVVLLARHRQYGANFAVLPLLWRWRRDLRYIGVANLISFARPIAMILLPKRIADTVRRLKRMCREVLMKV
jgi:glycosyltransferase involved in cell wall biosynthesis